MPYIKKDRREALGAGPDMASTSGELNFLFTCLAIAYWYKNGRNYQAINDVLGALEGTKLEFYRRLVVPYEDTKIKENGDVYGP